MNRKGTIGHFCYLLLQSKTSPPKLDHLIYYSTPLYQQLLRRRGVIAFGSEHAVACFWDELALLSDFGNMVSKRNRMGHWCFYSLASRLASSMSKLDTNCWIENKIDKLDQPFHTIPFRRITLKSDFGDPY